MLNSLKRFVSQPIRAPHPRVIARFTAAFIIAILAWFALRDPLVGLHMRVSNAILQQSDHANTWLVIKDDELYLSIRQPTASGKGSGDRLYRRGNRYGITWGSIFYITLLLCIPLRVAGRRWRYLLVVALIFFSLESVALLLSVFSHPGVGGVSGELTGLAPWVVHLQRGLARHQFLVFTMLCLLFLPLFVEDPQQHASPH